MALCRPRWLAIALTATPILLLAVPVTLGAPTRHVALAAAGARAAGNAQQRRQQQQQPPASEHQQLEVPSAAIVSYVSALYPDVALTANEARAAFESFDYYYHCESSVLATGRGCSAIQKRVPMPPPPLPYLPAGAYYSIAGHLGSRESSLHPLMLSQFDRWVQPVHEIGFSEAEQGALRRFSSSFGSRVGPQPSWTDPYAVVRYVLHPNGMTSDKAGQWIKASVGSSSAVFTLDQNSEAVQRLLSVRDGDAIEVQQWGAWNQMGLWANIWRGTGMLMRLRRPFVSMSRFTAILEMILSLEPSRTDEVVELAAVLGFAREHQQCRRLYPASTSFECLASALIGHHPCKAAGGPPELFTLMASWLDAATAKSPQRLIDEWTNGICAGTTRVTGSPLLNASTAAANRFALFWLYGVCGRGSIPERSKLIDSFDSLLALLACMLGHQTIIMYAAPNDNGLISQELVDYELPHTLGWTDAQSLRTCLDKVGRLQSLTPKQLREVHAHWSTGRSARGPKFARAKHAAGLWRRGVWRSHETTPCPVNYHPSCFAAHSDRKLERTCWARCFSSFAATLRKVTLLDVRASLAERTAKAQGIVAREESRDGDLCGDAKGCEMCTANVRPRHPTDYLASQRNISTNECSHFCAKKPTCAAFLHNRYDECYALRVRSPWIVADDPEHGSTLCQMRQSLCQKTEPLLASSTEEDVEFAGRPGNLPGRYWRYYSALPCKPDNASAALTMSSTSVCIMFKNGRLATWVGVATSTDGIHFGSVRLMLPSDWSAARMTHNTAVLLRARDAGVLEYVVVGGQHRPRVERGAGDVSSVADRGIFVSHGESLCFSSRCEAPSAMQQPVTSQWAPPRRMLDGRHAGCVERANRAVPRGWNVGQGVCEFDGRLSLVHFDGQWQLFTRANVKIGSRFVQRTTSKDLNAWEPFAPIALADYNALSNNIYYFAVQVNPVDNASLVAVFPLVHRYKSEHPYGGCIAISCSHDGLTWSSPVPLVSCPRLDRYNERTMSAPVAGLIRTSWTIDYYVQHNVPEQEPPDFLQPRARIVRHQIPIEQFRAYSQMALESVRSDGRTGTLDRALRGPRLQRGERRQARWQPVGGGWGSGWRSARQRQG